MAKKQLRGKVTSDKMEKTVVVEVEKVIVHPLYNKRMRRHVNYKAQNEIEAKTGDVVILEEYRPLSHGKRWLVKEVVNEIKEEAK